MVLEKYDLDELYREIREDEKMEADRRKPQASQDDIQRMIRRRREAREREGQ